MLLGNQTHRQILLKLKNAAGEPYLCIVTLAEARETAALR